MAVRVVEGVPGSGKTYYAVHHLVTNYFRWDDAADAYVKRDERLRVISNIDRLSIAESLDDLVRAAGGIAKFFTWSHQKALAETHRLVYVIDEAQTWFPRTFRNVDVFTFFQKHRHLGVDVYLITQDVATLALELRQLAEYYVRAVRRTFSLMGEFRYKFVGSPTDKTGFRTKVLKRDRGVFALYTSMTADETEKVKSAPLRYLIIFTVGLLAFFGFIYWIAFHYWPAKARPARAEAATVSRKPPAAANQSTQINLPAGNSSVMPAIAPTPAPAPVVVAIAQARVAGLVLHENGDGLVVAEVGDLVQRWRLSDFIVRCQCDPAHLPPGAVVELYNVAGPGALGATRATGGSAPVSQPSAIGSPATDRTIATPTVRLGSGK